MKKLMMAAAVASACWAPQAFAQGKSFEGLSLGLSANFNSGKTDIPGQSPSESSTTAGLKAAYGWAMNPTFILGLSVSYDMGNVKMGTTANGATGLVGKGLTVISIDPGAKISNSTLLYARLGYAAVKDEASGGINASENYDGTAIGIGLRNMMGKNWSLEFEYLQPNFTAKRSTAFGGDVKPGASVLSIGVNYHF